jgi:transcriptional/translational regulatory protein YebC/TACO1
MSELDRVTAGLEAKKLPIQSSKLAYVPKNKKPITGRDAEVCLGLIEGLDDHDDVQNVYTDLEVSEEDMQRIAGGV